MWPEEVMATLQIVPTLQSNYVIIRRGQGLDYSHYLVSGIAGQCKKILPEYNLILLENGLYLARQGNGHTPDCPNPLEKF